MSRRDATSADDRSTLTAYLREIAKLPRLTVAQERELGARIQRDKDEASISRLVESNLRFVVSYARRYRGLGVSLLDLIHDGNLGLIEAARRFDPRRNVKFVTDAVWWIRQAMVHALAEHTGAAAVPPRLLLALGAAVDDGSGEWSRAFEPGGPVASAPLIHHYGGHDDTSPTLREIGNRLHLSPERVRRMAAHATDQLRRSARLRSHLN